MSRAGTMNLLEHIQNEVSSIRCGSMGALLIRNGKPAYVAEGLDSQEFFSQTRINRNNLVSTFLDL